MLVRWPARGTIDAVDEMSQLCMKTRCDMLFATQPTPELTDLIRMVLDARAI